jgi:predicted nuclease of predicted toxin-antitoxin system
MKRLIDMNLSPRWASFLTAQGVEAVHWSTLGPASAPDADIMAYASTHDFVVFTHDLDFSAILAATQGEKPSVVQIRSDDVRPEAVGRQVIAALRQMEAELEQGALLTVEPHRLRGRVLPLRSRH